MGRATAARLHRAKAGPPAAARGPERAELVWQRAVQLAGPRAFHDRFNNALDLLRVANHDPATMTHALSIGRRHLRTQTDNGVARAAATILEAAIAFLGVKPRTGEPAEVGRSGTATHTG